VDDATNAQNPDPIPFARGGQPLSATNTLRGGDTVDGITGVLTYTWAGNAASGNAYRLRPIGALGGTVPDFQPTNPRPAAPEAVGGSLKVASFNVLNYFNTFGRTSCTFGVGGATAECRGADNAAEFERQAAKTVSAIVALDADVVGLIEIENDGYGPGSAIRDLVDRLNAVAGPGTYAVLDVDTATGQANAAGTDAIKVGFIYRPASAMPVGTTAVLNTGAFGDFTLRNGSVIGRNRPAVTQAFQDVAGGGRVVVSVNHLKSKGSSCADNASPVPSDPDTGDGQGNCNLTRTQAAKELVAWLAGDPTGTGDSDVLVIGDLNAYAKEDPVRAMTAAGYTDLIAEHIGERAYSYVFDGQWGYLDHALGSASLRPQVTGVTEWHINADEPPVLDYNTNFKTPNLVTELYAPDPYRSSDHDPVLIGLALTDDRSARSPEPASSPRPRRRSWPRPRDTFPAAARFPVP
jgi:predicted extracellular nuclease